MSLVMWIHSGIHLHASQKISAYLWDFLLHSADSSDSSNSGSKMSELSTWSELSLFSGFPGALLCHRASVLWIGDIGRAADRQIARTCALEAMLQALVPLVINKSVGCHKKIDSVEFRQIRWRTHQLMHLYTSYFKIFYIVTAWTLFSNSSRRQTKNENSKAIHRWLASKSETFRPKLKMPNENLMRVGSERNFPTKLHQLHQLPRQEQHGLRNWCREYWLRFGKCEHKMLQVGELTDQTWSCNPQRGSRACSWTAVTWQKARGIFLFFLLLPRRL